MLELMDRLNDAYGMSTRNHNYFKDAIDRIKWDTIFTADGETYFIKDDFTLMVENLDPFREAWKPSVMIGTFYKELGYL